MSRKVLILANVGNRDVTYEGNFVSPARENGAELYGRYAEISANIDLPILLPALWYLESLEYKYPEISCEDLTLRLFYTDQKSSDHRKNDTLELARIAKDKLLEEFSTDKKGSLRFRGQKAIHLSAVSSNPSRYDHMHGFYEDFFDQNRHIRNPEEYVCFVLLSGGTPQMNAMLLLHSVRHFGRNCVQVYVSPGEGARDLRVGAQIARTDARRQFNEALKVRQFRAAAEIATNALEGASGKSAACRYAEHRLAFDFKRAREYCERSTNAADSPLEDDMQIHLDAVNELERDAVSDGDKKRLLAELFYNLEVKYRSGEFVDVLGRMFRLQEALLTWIVEGYTEIRTGPGKKLLDHKDVVESVPGLLEFLNNYKSTNGAEVKMESKIDRIALMAVTEHLSTPESGLAPEDRSRAANAATAAASIEKLVNLRNKTIIAHGFEGVSEGEIVAAYGGSETLIEDLRACVGTALNKDLSTNPFFELSERLRF